MSEEKPFADNTLDDELTVRSITDPRLQDDPLVGSIIGQRFEVLSVIARGGMGVLYAGRHVEIGRRVAIKVLQAHLVEDEGAYLRFLREAKLAGTLMHRNICHVSDFGRLTDGSPYLIMDLLMGETLSSILKKELCMAPDKAINIFRQICDALSYAHNMGIIHRDLKPSNVMIERDGDLELVKVLDFGIAKSLAESSVQLTGTHEVVGSPYYMSPEQCSAKPLDQRSDIYSLGCLMFETLTGRPPFVGEGPMQVMFLHSTSEVPALSAALPEAKFSKKLEQAVGKCLQKDPASRFQSAHELKAALDDARTQDPNGPILGTSQQEQSKPESARESLLTTITRSRVILVLALAVVIPSLLALTCFDSTALRMVSGHLDVALPAFLSQPVESFRMLVDGQCPGFVYNGDTEKDHILVWNAHDLGAISNPQVHAIWVTQAHNQPRSKDDDPEWPGEITVHVTNATAKTILVLDSNAPMHWNIVKDPGCQIEQVLVTSVFGKGHSATVDGVDKSIVQTLPAQVPFFLSAGEKLKQNSYFVKLDNAVTKALADPGRSYSLHICTFQYADQLKEIAVAPPL